MGERVASASLTLRATGVRSSSACASACSSSPRLSIAIAAAAPRTPASTSACAILSRGIGAPSSSVITHDEAVVVAVAVASITPGSSSNMPSIISSTTPISSFVSASSSRSSSSSTPTSSSTDGTIAPLSHAATIFHAPAAFAPTAVATAFVAPGRALDASGGGRLCFHHRLRVLRRVSASSFVSCEAAMAGGGARMTCSGA
mmetsp:Transcript_15143/g.38202  ORF Transcript_15143/g.38202 Transcript_15143/m.38202 type:complete len:202 (-) Transcript_15143:988-1593(-)